MATTATTKKPIHAGITTEETAYATRYKQGGRTVFGLSVSPAQLVNMVARPDPSVPNPGNRAIRENHAKQFAVYYLNHADWVSPALILRAPSIFKFESAVETEPGMAQWGIVSYPRRQASSIQILDGQHRILGFHIALSMIQQRIEKARDQHRRALSSESGNKQAPVVLEAQRVIRDAEKLQERFDNEQISLEIQVTDNTSQYRQMFFDIADNALGITASVKARFDTRKVVNRALPLVLEHPLLLNRVDLENDRVKRSGSDYAAARHIVEIIRAVQVGADGRIGRRMEEKLSETTLTENTKKFLDLALQAFPQLEALRIGQISAETLRDTSLLGSPNFLRALGGVYHQLLSDKHAWTREAVLDYFKALEPHMLGGAHANSIWMRVDYVDQAGNKVKSFVEGSMAPNGIRQAIAGIEKTLVDWAILGPKGAPWVWEAPAAPPVAPKTEDEILLEEQIAADPELAQLLEAQLEMEKKTVKS